MSTYIALLRAVNVGGNTILTMSDLASLCEGLGFENVRTYIQSGNVIFKTPLSEKSVRNNLESALTKHMGKKMDVVIRTAAEFRKILDNNPFPDSDPARVIIHFYTNQIPKNLLAHTMTPGGESIEAGAREIYVEYPEGIGKSKLKLPTVEGTTTSRNLNTTARILAFITSPKNTTENPATEETENQ